MNKRIIAYISHNSSKLIIESIKRIGNSFNYFIVENGEEKSYKELSYFRKNSDFDIKVIQMKNLGFGAACNLVASLNNNCHIFYLNPDCIINNLDIKNCFEQLEKNIGSIISPIVYDGDTGNIQNLRYSWTNYWKVIPIWLNARRLLLHKKNTQKNITKPIWVAGSAFFITSESILGVGGFDENFFLYFEEEDLFRRLYKKGIKLRIAKNSTATHYAGTSTETSKNIMREYMLISGLYYTYKWSGKKSWLVLKLFIITLIYLRLERLIMPSNDRTQLLHRIKYSNKGFQFLP